MFGHYSTYLCKSSILMCLVPDILFFSQSTTIYKIIIRNQQSDHPGIRYWPTILTSCKQELWRLKPFQMTCVGTS